MLSRAAGGEEIELTRSGAPVAVIGPPQARLISAKRFRELLASAPSPDERFGDDPASDPRERRTGRGSVGILIDTDLLIDLERGDGGAEELLGDTERAISAITVSELLHGVLRVQGAVSRSPTGVRRASSRRPERDPDHRASGANPRRHLVRPRRSRRDHRSARSADRRDRRRVRARHRDPQPLSLRSDTGPARDRPTRLIRGADQPANAGASGGRRSHRPLGQEQLASRWCAGRAAMPSSSRPLRRTFMISTAG